MLPKVRRDFRVSDDESGGSAYDDERRYPIPPASELRRKKPDVFLIFENPARHFLPRDVDVFDGRRRGSSCFGCGDRRVWKTRGDGLRMRQRTAGKTYRKNGDTTSSTGIK